MSKIGKKKKPRTYQGKGAIRGPQSKLKGARFGMVAPASSIDVRRGGNGSFIVEGIS